MTMDTTPAEFQRQLRGLFAVLRTLVRQTTGRRESVEDYAARLEGRIGALARVHEMLMRAPADGIAIEFGHGWIAVSAATKYCTGFASVGLFDPQVLLQFRIGVLDACGDGCRRCGQEFALREIRCPCTGKVDGHLLSLRWRRLASPCGDARPGPFDSAQGRLVRGYIYRGRGFFMFVNA